MNISPIHAKVDKRHNPAKKTVLVVDDEPDIVDTIKLWLQKHNFTESYLSPNRFITYFGQKLDSRYH
jgi:PleD family two-component response regulator